MGRPDLVFVDAGPLYARVDRSDTYHRAALDRFGHLAEQACSVMTTSLVVGEVFALLQRKLGHPLALRWLATLTRSNIGVTWPVSHLQSAATHILQQFPDQDFSFTDAVSFGLMQRNAIRRYLSFDHHFSVFGRVHGWEAV